MAEPKRGSVAAFKAAEERRKARLSKPSAPKSNARKEAFNKKVASINKSRTDQGSVSKFKAAEERRQQRLAKVNQPKYGSPKMKRQRAMADVEKDLPKSKVARTTTASAMGADRVANRATKVADAGKTAKPIAAPKAEASTPKKSVDLSGFGAAFKKARAQGVGTKFAYNDKQYAAVTKDDISRAGKSSLKEFLESSKRKATTELAKAPGQIVNKQSGGMISDEKKKRIAEMMRKRKQQSTQKRRLNREDFEKIKGAYEKLGRTPARPMPMDPNMQREAKPMPMTPGERPDAKKYERPIGRPELKERPIRGLGKTSRRPDATPYKSYYNKDTNSVIFSDAKNQNEIDSILNQMQKSPAEDRYKSGGSVMARGCKMGRKKATKLY